MTKYKFTDFDGDIVRIEANFYEDWLEITNQDYNFSTVICLGSIDKLRKILKKISKQLKENQIDVQPHE